MTNKELKNKLDLMLALWDDASGENIDKANKLLLEIEKQLPFKNQEEHEKWMDYIATCTGEQFVEACLRINNNGKVALEGKKKDALEHLMRAKCLRMSLDGISGIKQYEIELQGVIERYTDKIWWKATNYYDIFMSLLETRDWSATITNVMEHIDCDANNNILVREDK